MGAGATHLLPPGSTVNVRVTGGDTARFKHWKAPGTMIHGSGEPSETFVVATATTVTVAERAEHPVMVSTDNGPPEVYAVALEGDYVSLLSPGDFTVEGHGSGMVDGYSAVSSATTVAGYLQQPVNLRTNAPGYSPEVTVSLPPGEGGVVLGAMGSGYPGYDTHIFAGSVSGRISPPGNCWGAHWLGYKGFPDVGYWCVQGERGMGFSMCLGLPQVELEFHKSLELILKVRVEGEGDARCAGSLTADPAGKYYGPDAEVMLQASAFPGYVFTGWEEEGAVAWVKDGPGDPYDGESLLMSDIQDDSIFIKMPEEDEPPQARTVTAVFERAKECLVVKAGNEIGNYLDARETLEAIGYTVTELAYSGLTEQSVLDAIREHSVVFVWNGHGTMWTGNSNGWLGWGATDPVWGITSEEITALNHGRAYKFVYIASCESGASSGPQYKAAFNASCYLGWVGLVSQSVDDPFDEVLWDEIEGGAYVQAAVATAMWEAGIEWGVAPYPNCIGNTILAPYCASIGS